MDAAITFPNLTAIFYCHGIDISQFAHDIHGVSGVVCEGNSNPYPLINAIGCMDLATNLLKALNELNTTQW